MDNLNSKDIILLVDDEPVVLAVGTLMIEKFGYKVVPATNGTEACQIFRENADDICLVILDMKLPGELGSDICKRLKKIKHDLKVLHTSGFVEIQSGGRLECGCDMFLLKPFKIEELHNALKNSLVIN